MPGRWVGGGKPRHLGLWVMRFPGCEAKAASQMKEQGLRAGTEDGGRRVGWNKVAATLPCAHQA